MHRLVQHSGRLFLSTVSVGELYVWAHQRVNPTPLIQQIENDLLQDVQVLDFDLDCAKEFGHIRGNLLKQGIVVGRMDLMIASVALVHNLIVVTHTTTDYQQVTGLQLEDWLTP
jgi:tRNA(fMet)-specific endonuclease VapC